MLRKSLFLGSLMLLALALAVGILPAARPPLTPQELNANADLIVTGTVKAVHLVQEEDVTKFVLDIVVQKVEKGKGVKSGDVIQARGHRLNVTVKGCSGHWIDFDTLIRGKSIRVFLGAAKGGYVILLPNGVEVLEPGVPALPFTMQEMNASADLVLTGTVKAIDRIDSGYTVKIAVQELEKGMGVKPGDQIVASYMFPAGAAKIGMFFHEESLRSGKPVRVFLKKTADGKFEILYPRGIRLIEAQQADPPEAKTLSDQWKLVPARSGNAWLALKK